VSIHKWNKRHTCDIRRSATGALSALVIAGALGTSGPAMASVAVAHGSGTQRASEPARLNAGVIPFTSASVTKNSNGTWTVSYAAPGVRTVAVYAGMSGSDFARTPVFGHGPSGSVTITTSAARPWAKLVPDHGAPLIVASRYLGLTGVLNARDAGGYRTTDGQWVRSGLVYRTAVLTPTASDLALLDSLGISTDYDLRTPAEIAATPDTVPAGTSYVNLNVLGDSSVSIPTVTTPTQAEQFMEEMEADFVNLASAKAAYKALLDGIANDKGASLYHCSAGKDRTGWATAVLLTLLGVAPKAVMTDYLLSNEYYLDTPEIQAELAAMPAAESAIYEKFLAAEPGYLQAGLNAVKSEYGSMYNYVVEGLGVTPATVAKLRAKLLEGAPETPQQH
jgi:protein-tyrosine phosphatase